MTEKKMRTIPLTGRQPVRIVDANWPVVAQYRWFAGQHECQANVVAGIIVRQHADGRAIVMGYCDRGPGGVPDGYLPWAGGDLVSAGDDLAGAVHRVAARAAELADGWCGPSAAVWRHMADAVVADLPPEVLS